MTITITAFERSPDGGKGLARLLESGKPWHAERLPLVADRSGNLSSHGRSK